MENKEIKQILETNPKQRNDLKIARLTNRTNLAILENEIKLIQFQVKSKLNLEMAQDKTKYPNADARENYVASQLVLNEDYIKKLKEISDIKDKIEMLDIELSYSAQMFESCLAFCYAGKEFLQ